MTGEHKLTKPDRKLSRKEMSLLKRTTVGCLAFVAIVNVANKYPANEFALFKLDPLSHFACQDANEAPEDILEFVNQQADGPDNKRLKELSFQMSSVLPYEDLDGDNMVEWQKSLQELYFGFAASEAEKRDLHLIDPKIYIDKLESANSYLEIIGVMQAYAAELGVNINLHAQAAGDSEVVEEYFSSTAEDQVTDELRNGVQRFMRALALAPKELYDFADIKEIYIVDTLKAVDNEITGKVTPMGRAEVPEGVIYLPKNYLKEGDGYIIMHEVAHVIDYRLSKSSTSCMLSDENITNLNERKFEYGTKDEGTLKSTARPYGASNLHEDKATYMEFMLNGLDTGFLDSNNPIIKAKYRLLLARLENAIPGFGKYLLATSPHGKERLYD